MLAGIRDLVASLEAETDECFANAPEHVRAALHPLGHPRFQVLHLFIFWSSAVKSRPQEYAAR